MLVLAFSNTIFLLATIGSNFLLATVGSSVVAHQSLLLEQQIQQVAKPATAMNASNETLDDAPFRGLSQLNSVAMLDSSNKGNSCWDHTSNAGYTTRTCITTIYGLQVKSIYVIDPSGVYFPGFCMTVARNPCKDSSFCTFPDGTLGKSVY